MQDFLDQLFTVPDAAVLPSLSSLSFRGIPEMFLDGQKFVLPDMAFKSLPMANLTSLAFVDCSLGAIRASKFAGLEGLQELVRDGIILIMGSDKPLEVTSF